MGINVGAFLAPLVCGTLGEQVGWHYGFAAAGVGMLMGLSIYLYAMPLLPPDELQKAKAAHSQKRPLDRNEWRAVIAILVLFVPTALFWATYEQSGNTIVLWADANTDRTISLFGFTAQIPITWFLAFNPFMIFAFTPFVVALWSRQAARGTEPSTITKMALGCFGVAISYLDVYKRQMVIILSWFGVISLLLAIIPVVAIYPILLYIGMLIGAQAFQSTPKAHAPAIVLALTPHVACLLYTSRCV